jgi:MraZ protein
MLIGEYQHSIDEKGRVIVPAKFREDLGECFYVAKGLDGCLFVFSPNEWKNLEDKIKSTPISKSRGLQRFFFSGALEVQPDKQGRILIPQLLREHANLIKEITFVGVSSRVEIWDTSRWEEANNALTEETIAQAMDLLGL